MDPYDWRAHETEQRRRFTALTDAIEPGTPDDVARTLVAQGMAALSPGSFAALASPEPWAFVPHLRVIDRVGQEVRRKGRVRSIISCPIRHGKTTLSSQYLSAWAAGHGMRVLLVSASERLARNNNRAGLDAIREFGVAVFGEGAAIRFDLKGAGSYELENGGGVTAVGIGGSVLGTGFDLIIIDDPVKSGAAARNVRTQEDLFAFWSGSLRGRLEPAGSVIVVLARWHHGDLAGRLLAQQAERGEEEGGSRWQEIRLPAVAEAADPLGREEGQPLWPERFDLRALIELAEDMDEESANAQLQMRVGLSNTTTPFPVDRWLKWNGTTISPSPVLVRGWDLASSTGSSSDYSATVLLESLGQPRNNIGGYNILHYDRIRAEPEDVYAWAEMIARVDAAKYGLVDHVIESTGAKAQAQALEAVINGVAPSHDVHLVPASGSKVERARPASAVQRAGLAGLTPMRGLTDLFVDECSLLGYGTHDDMADALAHAWQLAIGTNIAVHEPIPRPHKKEPVPA